MKSQEPCNKRLVSYLRHVRNAFSSRMTVGQDDLDKVSFSVSCPLLLSHGVRYSQPIKKRKATVLLTSILLVRHNFTSPCFSFSSFLCPCLFSSFIPFLHSTPSSPSLSTLHALTPIYLLTVTFLSHICNSEPVSQLTFVAMS